ncbi:magnesium-translocating P-type ATPase [Streptomyces sp. NBC_01013]|uniref:magnesium-translocating P-type ATPase n=1 Tax=Streptomyces sp. NBC_01013 TaxID=2903718 RepID=UPI003867D504
MPENAAAAGSGQTGEQSATVLPMPGAASAGGGVRPSLPPTSLQVLRSLDSGPRGLLEAEAQERLTRFGENTLTARRPVPWPRRFLRALRDPFTSVLLCLGLVSALVGAWGTAAVTSVLVVVSCLLRSREEHRADRATAALHELVATTATVVRRTGHDTAARGRELPVGELVPGDVIRLAPGDLVPADVHLLRASGLTVYQSALTGESVPVAKHPLEEQAVRAAVPHGLPDAGDGVFAQRQSCFQGSSVASGSGTAVVVATGGDTRFAAAYERSARRRGTSAFDRSVRGISWTLVRFMLLTPPLVLMANAALRGRGLETLPFAVAVAVGLTPEMLPVIVTAALARGASLLAREHAVIVKRLPALHDLGAIDVLCLDKTGTLTQDRPVVDRSLGPAGALDPRVLHWAAANALWTLQLADLPTPDALDEAVLDAWDRGPGEDAAPLPSVEEYDAVAALPFDPVRRLSTAVVRAPGRFATHVLVTKGAVEAVLERCDLEPAERDRLGALAAREAAAGLRLLAVARTERPARLGAYTPADERELAFLGFVTLRDALTPSASDALGVLMRRGIAVKVLTGDHPGTAARACRDLGMDPGQVLSAGEIDDLSAERLAGIAGRTTVFARCTPAHKARIVDALRASGHTTGFLGDGVNDVPALHAADVGICPRNAVDVAREAADVVLAEKDLGAIDHAITAGRRSSGTIATYLRITLSSNLGNVIAMLAAGLLLPFLPMLPAQVLVQNLCFDAAQLAFAFDRPGSSAVGRPAVLRPRDFLRFITGFGLLNAAADLATFGVLALALHDSPANGQAAFHSGWFTENLLTQALVMLLLRTGRTTAQGRGSGPLRVATAALAVVGVFLPLTALGPMLGMGALPPLYYLLLAAVLTLYACGLGRARTRYERNRRFA